MRKYGSYNLLKMSFIILMFAWPICAQESEPEERTIYTIKVDTLKSGQRTSISPVEKSKKDGNDLYPAVLQDDSVLNSHYLARKYGRSDFYFQDWRFNMFVPVAAKLAKQRREVVVAFIGAGANLKHRGVSDNLWINLKEKNGKPGVDDDGNGYVDDVHGYDFYARDATPAEDLGGFGTAGAGVINGLANHVDDDWSQPGNVKIMVLRNSLYLPKSSVILLDPLATLDALKYAKKMGADIIVWPYGIPDHLYKEELTSVIQSFDGLIFVTPLGGDALNKGKSWPLQSDFENVVGLSYWTDRFSLATFLFEGSPEYTDSLNLDFAAPSGGYSPNTFQRYGSLLTSFDGKGSAEMNAGFAGGFAAQLLAHFPSLSAQQLKEIMLSSVDQHAGWHPHLKTGGSINSLKGLLGRSVGGCLYVYDWAERESNIDSLIGYSIGYSDHSNYTFLVGGEVLESHHYPYVERINLNSYTFRGRSITLSPINNTGLHVPDSDFINASNLVYNSENNQLWMLAYPDDLFDSAVADNKYLDTYAWDGSKWNQIRTNTGIPFKYGYQWMIFDEMRSRIVLYQGFFSNQSEPVSCTWEFVNGDWQKINGITSPPLRSYTSICYDSHRGVTVLFGGIGNNELNTQSVWEYDGSKWREINKKGPLLTHNGISYFDERLGKIVYYAGGSGFGRNTGTWAWDGKAWELLSRYDIPEGGFNGDYLGVYNSAEQRLYQYTEPSA